jgi:pyrroloquinoline quinone biosynthesis protein D
MQDTVIDSQGRPALAARVRLQIDPINGEPVLLYPEGLLRLNATAHEVVARCDGKTTVADIIISLGNEYEVSAETMRADVLDCLVQLQHRQLVVIAT